MGEGKALHLRDVLGIDKRTGEIVPLKRPEPTVDEVYRRTERLWQWIEVIGYEGCYTGDAKFSDLELIYAKHGIEAK